MQQAASGLCTEDGR